MSGADTGLPGNPLTDPPGFGFHVLYDSLGEATKCPFESERLHIVQIVRSLGSPNGSYVLIGEAYLRFAVSRPFAP